MSWAQLQAIVDGQPEPTDRADCPVCGVVLVSNGSVWECPRAGAKHWKHAYLPKD